MSGWASRTAWAVWPRSWPAARPGPRPAERGKDRRRASPPAWSGASGSGASVVTAARLGLGGPAAVGIQASSGLPEPHDHLGEVVGLILEARQGLTQSLGGRADLGGEVAVGVFRL